jgi:hypothetical protein
MMTMVIIQTNENVDDEAKQPNKASHQVCRKPTKAMMGGASGYETLLLELEKRQQQQQTPNQAHENTKK